MFTTLNQYQVKNGLDINLVQFERIILSLIWKASVAEPDADRKQLGQTIFGTGKLLNLITNLQLDSLIEENFDGWNDPMDTFKTTNLNLGHCTNYREKFEEWYTSEEYGEVLDTELFTIAMDQLEKRSSTRPSQLFLVGYIFSFLWDLQKSIPGFELNDGHINYIMDTRDYVIADSPTLDPNNIKNSLLAFHQTTIFNFKDESFRHHLQYLFDNHLDPHFINAYSLKYQFISSTEDSLSCNENPSDIAKIEPENIFITEMTTLALTEYFKNDELAKMTIAIHDMVNGNGIQNSPSIEQAVQIAIQESSDTTPPVLAPCSFYGSNRGKGCPTPRCDIIHGEFVDAWKSKRNQKMFKYGWALEITIPETEYDNNGWSVVVRVKSNIRGSFQVWNANFFGFYENSPGLCY